MIYVVRHGQTDLNKEKRLQGRQGMPLNEEGIKQAEILREELKEIKFDCVFSSPQERAIQTAEIVSGLKAIPDVRLDVFDLGEADRLRREEVMMRGPVPDPSIYKGVENIKDFIKRVFHFMSELEGRYHKEQINILISGHRCTTGCMGAYFLGEPQDGDLLKFSSNNGKYKVYEFEKRQII
ncbi:histidine phosphatase family protein [Paenibacillus solani]|uniref:Phosphoglycerate mutase n=1 Tax=Paenibacillus solani TaxID=1705565 RepID=A0A0M1P706_9BACL|nr:histidine phosphatase family protein [Paenibacillus solani]KOR90263.1 phosphoglycerate mutase [Paenibacillus solani]